jgi:hypothetical protein
MFSFEVALWQSATVPVLSTIHLPNVRSVNRCAARHLRPADLRNGFHAFD